MSLEFREGDGGGGAGGAGLPGATTGLLPPGAQTDKLALLEAAIGKPVPLAYGLHLVGGNVILNEELASGERVLFIALGEGEWDGIEALFVNGKLFDHTDTTRCHFHPGLDGETGTETDPSVRNQKICSLWPSSFADKFTFSRTAYLALKLAPDPAAPEPVPRVVGIYRTRKLRIFDSAGTQTAFQYSTNPADIYADLLISAFVKPRGLINEALTAGEKAYFDFAQLDTFRSDCNVTTPQGTTRFEAHPAFYSSTDLLRALELLFLLSRAYHLEKAGKFAPFMNKVRASALTLGPNDFAPGSFSVGERDTRDAANKYLGKFRNLDAGKGAGTIATTGTAVTGTGTKFLAWFRAGSPVRLLDGAQAGQVRKVASVAGDTAMTLATAFSADQSGRAYSNPELQLSKSEKYVEDETHQAEVGRVLTLELDLHNQIPERAERILKYTKAKSLDVVKQIGLRALWVPGVLDLLPGDVFTAPGKWDFYDAANNQDWELLKLVIHAGMTFELGGEKYDAALYSDAAGAQQGVAPSIPGTGLSPNATPLTAPAAPTWISMDGRGGEFRGEIASGAGNLAPIEHQVQMASDTGFSANVEDFALGTASKFNFYRPGLVRYWRARSRYPNGAWSAWTNFGAPTAVNSLLIDLESDVQDGTNFVRTTPNQRDGGGRAYNALTASNNLVGTSKVGGDSGLASARIPEVLFEDGGVGKMKPGKFASANPGIVTGAQQLALGTSTNTSGNWIVVATVDFEVPVGVTSLTLRLTGTNIGTGGVARLAISGDNLGASIHTGAAPGTPQQTRTGTGDVTFTSPSGNKLSVYGRGTSGLADDWEVKATQDITTPLRTGTVV